MNLIPYRQSREGFDGLLDIQKEINELFNATLPRWGGRALGLLDGEWTPAVDVYESKDDVVVKADLPGLKKEDIDVSVHEGVLTIRGEKRESSETKEKGFVRSERFVGAFQRAIALPSSVDASKVKAAYKNGVLELTLPKREEAKPRQIQIQVD